VCRAEYLAAGTIPAAVAADMGLLSSGGGSGRPAGEVLIRVVASQRLREGYLLGEGG